MWVLIFTPLFIIYIIIFLLIRRLILLTTLLRSDALQQLLMLRFMYKHKAKWIYLPKVLVRMRTGGASDGGWKGMMKVNKEIQRGMQQNGLKAPMWKIYMKYVRNLWQLVRRPI